MCQPLHLDAPTWRLLLARLGPSLALWRAAEIAILRQQTFEPPVLDLGCGDGIVTAAVLDRVALGADPDRRQLQLAGSQGIYDRLEPSLIQELELEPGQFGTIVSNSVLEHVPDLDSVLAAASRLLRPGGRLVFTVPSERFTCSLALHFRRYGTWRNLALQHRNLWPIGTWAHVLKCAGLEIETACSYLRPELVALWDAFDLSQQIWIGRTRLVSLLWRRLSPGAFDRLAAVLASLDLSATSGGGTLIVARKPADRVTIHSQSLPLPAPQSPQSPARSLWTQRSP
ncbi:MAG TPA: class I SAM-dependent methyltransferase [Chloroflexota bacterium]|nr:class I SAM-dependent methyltransferase [Chloroflexota bacterium]